MLYLFARRTLTELFIHYSLWFKWFIHLKETYAHGSRWARKEETPLSKNPIQQPNYFSLLSLSVFYIERNGGRRFNMIKPNCIWEKIKTQIQPFHCYRLGSESQTQQTIRHFQPSQWAHSVDQHSPSFCLVSSLCLTSSPSQKSPVGLYYPLRILSVPKHAWGTAKRFGCGWFNLLVFVANNVSRVCHSGIHADSQTSVADGKDNQKIDRIWRKDYLAWAIYCCQLQHWLPGKWLNSKKLKPYFFYLFLIIQVFIFQVFLGRRIL